MLFKNDDRIRFLLPQLAETIQEMEHERVNSGIETTPDETSNVIEAFFNYIGRLWIAELMFLTERATDETHLHTWATNRACQIKIRHILVLLPLMHIGYESPPAAPNRET